ncbi:MAG: carbamate kinase, partial [Deltaproteobacteria bacterium]|nr:carbamate kinase [Deltaproteobacteria bacterium]
VDIIEDGCDTVITHGNGPQVGFILRRSEIAYRHEGLHFVPMVSCVADTQGALGYQIQQALENEFKRRRLMKKAVTVVTQVEVNREDPSFARPTKPIGSFYDQQQSRNLQKDHPDWVFLHDVGRGYRRAVASPRPIRIIELEAIDSLIKQGFCVVATGGGGIPVVRQSDGSLEGCDAVVDKDFASSLLASNLGADTLLISTAVDNVYLHFGQENQTPLKEVSAKEIQNFMAQGHFSDGSMLPKVKAALEFLENGGSRVIITSPHLLRKAMMGEAGTCIYK